MLLNHSSLSQVIMGGCAQIAAAPLSNPSSEGQGIFYVAESKELRKSIFAGTRFWGRKNRFSREKIGVGKKNTGNQYDEYFLAARGRAADSP